MISKKGFLFIVLWISGIFGVACFIVYIFEPILFYRLAGEFSIGIWIGTFLTNLYGQRNWWKPSSNTVIKYARDKR